MTNAYGPVELLRAIHRAEADELKEMIADGADVDAQSEAWSPAMQACGDGQIKCLRVLIAAGADLDASGERGMTPLMIAAMEDDEPCLAELLKAGVDLEKKDGLGNTAAWHAAAYGALGRLGRLFKAGPISTRASPALWIPLARTPWPPSALGERKSRCPKPRRRPAFRSRPRESEGQGLRVKAPVEAHRDGA